MSSSFSPLSWLSAEGKLDGVFDGNCGSGGLVGIWGKLGKDSDGNWGKEGKPGIWGKDGKAGTPEGNCGAGCGVGVGASGAAVCDSLVSDEGDCSENCVESLPFVFSTYVGGADVPPGCDAIGTWGTICDVVG